MAHQATQGIESAIVLAPANSLAEKCDSSLKLAFRASLPELLAVPKDKLQVVNVDVKSAVCTGLAAPERLRPWRRRILDELPRFDVNALEHLEQYAKASIEVVYFRRELHQQDSAHAGRTKQQRAAPTSVAARC